MKKQTITCQACADVVAYVERRDDGDYLRFQFGGPLVSVKDGQPTVAQRSSQWFTVNIAEELDGATDSQIDVECGCAENGAPRKWNFPLRATLDTLGTRRGIAL